ncbi:MAG: tRNA glutamyl-Q(34) synthetase GluQRS [Burkholderiales bacterium]
MDLTTPYLGRFAPTPSGPLHLGSMVAAVGSYLDARAHRGSWFVRIDDLDEPRVVPGASESILDCLQRFGMRWDGDVAYQRLKSSRYASAFETLRASDAVYPCACSRREVEQAGMAGAEAAVYPGTCRNGMPEGRTARAWRMRTTGVRIRFDDKIQGLVEQDLAADIGDFVLARADGVPSYHLACVVDDAESGITHVVRGADLVNSTPRQILVQQHLGFAGPEYLHLPVVVNRHGEKLSKQTRAPAVDPSNAAAILRRILQFLGQEVPRDQNLEDLWEKAIAGWSRVRVPPTARVDL